MHGVICVEATGIFILNSAVHQDTVVFDLQLLQYCLQLCFEVYFVVISCTTTYGLYLPMEFPFICLSRNPLVICTNVQGTVVHARSSAKTQTCCVFIICHVPQTINMTCVAVSYRPVTVSFES